MLSQNTLDKERSHLMRDAPRPVVLSVFPLASVSFYGPAAVGDVNWPCVNLFLAFWLPFSEVSEHHRCVCDFPDQGLDLDLLSPRFLDRGIYKPAPLESGTNKVSGLLMI